jgi:hypothetical protein
LIGLRRVRAVKIRRGEQTLDVGDFLVNGVDLRLHPFQFACFLERKFAGLRCFRSGDSGERRRLIHG